MNLPSVENIVNAVLYEGYVLYPYRPSSVKNRQRWTFGGLYPRGFSEVRGGIEPYSMQTECLVQGGLDAVLEVRVRFLHVLAREVRELLTPSPYLPLDLEGASRLVESLSVGNKLYQTWQEATERDAVCIELSLAEILSKACELPFTFAGQKSVEELRSAEGEVVGAVVREHKALVGCVSVSAVLLEESLFRVTVLINNLTPWEDSAASDRRAGDEIVLSALASTHTILGILSGEFVPLLGTPPEDRGATSGCSNVGTWPVLVGREGERDMMLSSPIILYDYPQVAPESQGDLFDGTEIDEILTLRIMTLTDDENSEMRAVDERAGALLDRTEAMTAEQMMNLHGTVRSLMVRGGTEDG